MQPPLPLSSKSADNKAQARRGPTPADSPRTHHRSTSPPAERQHPPVTPPQTPPPSPEDPLETSPELPPHHPKPTPFAEDIQANPQFETLDHHQAIHSRGSATPSAEQVPPPKLPTNCPKARLTARQCQLMRRLPTRPSPADLEVLSDAGLRALMKANGLPRSRDQRRGDYISAIAAWLAGDVERQLAFPGSVERAAEGEPVPPSPPSSPPPTHPPHLLACRNPLRAPSTSLPLSRRLAPHCAPFLQPSELTMPRGRGGRHGRWWGGRKRLPRRLP